MVPGVRPRPCLRGVRTSGAKITSSQRVAPHNRGSNLPRFWGLVAGENNKTGGWKLKFISVQKLNRLAELWVFTDFMGNYDRGINGL